jgi:hypothetical protein
VAWRFDRLLCTIQRMWGTAEAAWVWVPCAAPAISWVGFLALLLELDPLLYTISGCSWGVVLAGKLDASAGPERYHQGY